MPFYAGKEVEAINQNRCRIVELEGGGFHVTSNDRTPRPKETRVQQQERFENSFSIYAHRATAGTTVRIDARDPFLENLTGISVGKPIRQDGSITITNANIPSLLDDLASTNGPDGKPVLHRSMETQLGQMIGDYLRTSPPAKPAAPVQPRVR